MRSWERVRWGKEGVVARIIVGGKRVGCLWRREEGEMRGEEWTDWVDGPANYGGRRCSDHLTDDHRSIPACKPKGTLYAVNNVLGLMSRFLRHALFGDA